MSFDKSQMHHIFSYFAKKELNEMYIFMTLRTLAFAMISIFIPIYLFELGHGLGIVLSYLVLVEFFMLLYHIFIPYLFPKMGFKNMMFASTMSIIVFYLLLRQLQFSDVSFHFLAFVSATATAFYWSAFHIHFKHASDKGKRGREFGLLQTVSMVMSVIAPILGAFFISLFGFDTLYYISSGLMLVSLIPFFMTRQNEHGLRYDPKKVFRLSKASFVHFCEGVSSASTIIFWPLFVYMILNNISIVGIMSSLGMFLMAVVTIYVGKISDKDFRHTKTILNLGSLGHSLSLFLRIFALSVGSVFSVQLLGSLTRTFISIPLLTLMYEHKSMSIAEAMTRREFFLRTGRIFTIVVSIAFGFSLIIPIILAGFAALGFSLVRENA